MKASANHRLEIGFGVLCMCTTGVLGCVPADDADDTDDTSDVIASAATGDPPPIIGCTDSPTSSLPVKCWYDALEMVYTDQWKCTPPGDLDGRCKTTTVGKSVSFTFFTQQYGSTAPGVGIKWRPSDAQGSMRVIIDGIDRALVWQGGNSSGFKSFPLATGLHNIRLIKPARDGDRAISFNSLVNYVF